MTIRNFHNIDLPDVLTLENLSHAFPWTQAIYEQCIKSGCKGWILEEDNIVKGFSLVSFQGIECHILNIMVHPDFQHQGLGRSLLDYVLNEAKKNNMSMAYLEVRRSNQHAINLYMKSDFVEIGVRKNYYQAVKGYEDAIVLARSFLD